jgi:hypothetical protein
VVLLVLGLKIVQFFFRAQSLPRNLPLLTLELSLGMSAISMAYLVSNGSRYMFPFFPIAWVVYSYWLIALFRYLDGWLKRGRENRLMESSLKLAFVIFILSGVILPNAYSALQRGYQAQYQTKSGNAPLIADAKKSNWEKTVFLIVNPIAPSFGYYASQMQMSYPVYGFPSWDSPELFKVPEYVRGLQDPTAVTAAEERIRFKARQGYHHLAFVTFQGGEKDRQIGQILFWLKSTYPLLLTRGYSGSESVTLYLFA